MSEKVVSRNGIPIRLTEERWAHIVEEHGEMEGLRADVLRTITEADRVFAGSFGELLAVRTVETGRALVVVYKETTANDGFIITAFRTSRFAALERRKQLWPLQK